MSDTSIDPLTGQTFEALWTGQIEPELAKLEVERKKAMNLSLLIWAGFGAVLVLEFFVFPDPRLLVFSAVGGAVVGYLPLQAVSRKTKQSLIATLCGPMGVAYTMSPAKPPMFERLQVLKLLPHPDDSHFEDMFTGKRGASDFMLCEATLTRGSGKNRTTVFRGQLFRVAFPRRFLGTTVVLRESGWLNRFECPKGLEKVGLEDPHFEKIFEVFGDDQVEARAILTPVFMEQLVALETAYAGKHIRCGFCEGDLMIALEGLDRFEVGSMFASLDQRSRAESMASDITAVLRLIDAFVAAPR